ncbi:universal stress protein [Amycolatopsis sp. NPDC059027]|uniref:universal stress protein n=1 Tax=unclassified Amycolatopsis TaxID=2618356 RepID=UPI00366C8918
MTDGQTRHGYGCVVVGVDGSASALDAVRWAARDAALRGRPLRLVHALGQPERGRPGRRTVAVGARKGEGDNEEACLRAAHDVAHAVDPGVEVVARLRTGDSRVVLLDESRHAELVVLGSRGLRGASRLLLGSAGLCVAGHGCCPLVVVRGRPGPSRPVLVGVDNWPDSAAAARFAFAEAALRGVGVTAVRTWSELGDSATAHAVHHAQLASCLARLIEEFPAVPVDHLVVRGRPRRVLQRYGERAGLIVVGSRGRSAFAGLLFGSASQELVGGAPCPVAVVPSIAAWRSPLRAGSPHAWKENEMDDREKAQAAAEARKAAGAGTRSVAELSERAVQRYLAAQSYRDGNWESEVDSVPPERGES